MEAINTPQNPLENELDESEIIVKSILSNIDEDSVRSLLSRQFENAGKGELIRRYVPIEDIKILSEASHSYGSYWVGEIEINPYVFEKNAERLQSNC